MYNETLTTSFTYQQTAVPLFTYSNNEYTHITDIERKFYEDVLTKYIRIGSVEQASTRAFVKQKLETCNGQPNVNCDAFQCYLIQGKFITDVENFNTSEQFFVDCVNNNKYITLSEFITYSFPCTEPINECFKSVWSAIPEAPKHGSPGEGELFLAFFCNGVKPLKGDLCVQYKNVELKGLGGRVFKGKRIDDKQAFEHLNNIEHGESFLRNFAKFIVYAAGLDTEEYIEDDIYSLILQYKNIQELICKAFDDYKNGKSIFRPKNIFLKIGGYAQLLCYMRKEKFNSLLCYDNSKADVILQFINLNNIDNLIQLYSLLESLPGRIVLNRNKDGKGFMISLKHRK